MAQGISLTQKQADAFNGSDQKTAMSAGSAYIKQTLTTYKSLAQRLHISACVAANHAAQYGDASLLNLFFEGLRVNDQTALRTWMGIHASFKAEVDGKEETFCWITYNKEKGFSVKSNTKRISFSDPRAEWSFGLWLEQDPFYDRNNVDDAIKAWNFQIELKKLLDRAKKIDHGESDKYEMVHTPVSDDLMTLMSLVADAPDVTKKLLEVAGYKTPETLDLSANKQTLEEAGIAVN